MTTPQGRLLRIVVLQMILTTASERPEWMQKILGDTKNALLQRLWKQQTEQRSSKRTAEGLVRLSVSVSELWAHLPIRKVSPRFSGGCVDRPGYHSHSRRLPAAGAGRHRHHRLDSSGDRHRAADTRSGRTPGRRPPRSPNGASIDRVRPSLPVNPVQTHAA